MGSWNVLLQAAHGFSSSIWHSPFKLWGASGLTGARHKPGCAVRALKWSLPAMEDQASPSTEVYSAVSFRAKTAQWERCKPNGKAWQPLKQTPEEPAQFTQGCVASLMWVSGSFIWVKAQQTHVVAMKKLESEAPQQLPARLEHGDTAGDCLHLQGWVWPAADPSLKPDISSSPVWGQLYRNATHYTSWVYKLIA